MRKTVILSAGLLSFIGCGQAVQKTREKPNIIFLLVDDLGWRDVGFMGSRYYETPNLDKLAAESMIFTNAYAACAVCSPTRASIQTGRYPARLGLTDWIRARFQVQNNELTTPPPYEKNEGRMLKTPSNSRWMDLEEITIAELLKKAGYFTCHIGKWHLGTDDYYPEKQGYDLNIGGSDMGNPVNYFDPYSNSKGVRLPNLSPRREGEYLVDRLADELVNVIRQHKDQPFFINMCYYAVHTPLMAKPEMINKYEAKNKVDEQNNAVYAAMVESVDQAVGKLLDELKKEKLLDHTMILFFSDNGGFLGSTSNKPLRSGKGYPYEGGIREPMFVYWKGVIQPGTKCGLPVTSVDFLPTLCSVANVALPDRPVDGRDISPVFRGERLDTVPLFWHFPHYCFSDVVPYSIIRDGNWKLIKRYERFDSARAKAKRSLRLCRAKETTNVNEGVEFELFNLENDLSEETDLSGSHPEKVKELDKKLQDWIKYTNAKLPVPN
jgi:arylsulfatase A-like enzyme